MSDPHRQRCECNTCERDRQLTAATAEVVRLRGALERINLRGCAHVTGTPMKLLTCFDRRDELACGSCEARRAIATSPPPAVEPTGMKPWLTCQWCGNRTREGEREFCPALPGTEQKCLEPPSPAIGLDQRNLCSYCGHPLNSATCQKQHP